MFTAKHQLPEDMNKKDIVGKFKTTNMTYYDGHSRTIHYTDVETTFPSDEQIASCSDPEGFITHANKAFVHMSGYSRAELIGKPHYLLHHPDMPSSVFADLWDSLKETGRWEGYVKNLRKDGGFYWVYASIFANYRKEKLIGYTSSRRAVPKEEAESKINEF